MTTASPVSRLEELRNLIASGTRLVWSKKDFVQYITDAPAVGEFETAKARAKLYATALALGLGCRFEQDENNDFIFSSVSGSSGPVKYIEVPVEVVREVVREVPVEVEKVVTKEVIKYVESSEKDKFQYEDKDGKKVGGADVRTAALIYPDRPAVPLAFVDYIEPVWYKRMASVLKSGKHVAIAGPPGGGKSTAPEQFFISQGQPFVVVNGDAGLRRRDLEGTPSIDKNGSWFQVAEFAAAAVNGWAVILNEVNAADPDALLWLNGIIETPHRITIGGRSMPVHPDFRLVVTYNPGLVGTKALPQAFKDRFFPIKLGFMPNAFLKRILLTKGMSTNAQYSERLLKYAQDCWKLHEKGNLRYQISPRRLFDVVFLMENVPGTTLEDAIRQAIVDAVDAPADCQMLMKLITAPLNDINPISQFA